jgi:membrane protein YdbS with pleckstrin-like domain
MAYERIWALLESGFKVPRDPPTLIVPAGERTESFRPAPGFLRYLKLHFWLVLMVIDGLVLAGWIANFVVHRELALILLPLYLFVGIVPDVIAYVAMHLRFDTTWYVLSNRSLRIRRGILSIRETSITFENVQNVEIKQGPLQRWFKISDLIVQTAGGGGGGDEPGSDKIGPHVGLIEGVENAAEIRDRIMDRVRRSRRSGLGDGPEIDPGHSWTVQHVACLREIHGEIVATGRGAEGAAP